MHFIMETLSEKYHPLYSGSNTIRKYTEKYKKLRPGDSITMTHINSNKEVLAFEHLIVKRIVVSSLDEISDNHYGYNHVFFESSYECFNYIKNIYKTDEDLFMAIYVN